MEITQKIARLFKFGFTQTVSKPPYKHIVQLGDPVLRCKCVPVERSYLQSPEFKKLLLHMKKAVKRYKCVGVSAPQLGVDLRVMAITCPSVEDFYGSEEEYKIKEMKLYPYSVWINPTLQILDYKKVSFHEGCESMRGFSAEVARFYRVSLTGWDECGIEKTEELSGWLARIVQHEMDHLEGRMYLDVAHVPSLVCSFWDRVNYSEGKIHLSYYPNKILSK